jgi:hypothetical protein
MYSKQNGTISKCLEKYKNREHQKNCCLSEEEKAAIEQQLKNKKEQLKN